MFNLVKCDKHRVFEKLLGLDVYTSLLSWSLNLTLWVARLDSEAYRLWHDYLHHLRCNMIICILKNLHINPFFKFWKRLKVPLDIKSDPSITDTTTSLVTLDLEIALPLRATGSFSKFMCKFWMPISYFTKPLYWLSWCQRLILLKFNINNHF